jgi:hypothetical protein
MEALLTPTVLDKLLGLWGPFALMAVGGWYALKWLAKRDDERNAKMLTIIETFTSVVANNTAAMQAAAASGDRMTAELKNLEGQVQYLVSQNRAPARKPLKRAA